MDFASAIMKMWPNGDQKIKGLRQGIIDSAPITFAKYNITSPLVLAHFMAQISHECGAGIEVVENLNYSAERMHEVWPSRFPTVDSAQPYAHNPRALADKVYNGRMGNQTGTDDGYNYRGRGGAQTTGKEGYQRVTKTTGIDVINNPDLINDPVHFLECALADFIACGCLPYAEKDDVVGVTKKLNGGTIGLSEREQWLSRWKVLDVPVPVGLTKPTAPKTSVPPSPTPKPPQPVATVAPWWKRFFGFG